MSVSFPRTGQAAMRLFPLGFLVLIVGISASAAGTPMSEYSRAELWFNSQSEADRKAIQADLIWTGDYSQVVDGLFGSNTFKSIKSFEAKLGVANDGILQSVERSRLDQESLAEKSRVGFSKELDDVSGLRIGLPHKLLKPPTTENGTRTYYSLDGRFRILIGTEFYGAGTFADVYEKVGNHDALGEITYRSFRPGFFIIAADKNGVTSYVRAIDSGYSARSVVVFWWGSNDADIRKLVVAISNSMEWQDNGAIAELPTAAPPSQVKESQSKDEKIAQEQLPPVQKIYQTGTGFFVTSAGHLITNAHVVEGCSEASLRMSDGRLSRASIVSRDSKFDLAILKSEVGSPASATFRNSPPIRLGTDIIVFGYPRLDLLTSTGNLVNGLISGLAGPQDDASLIQISAPVQSGNSGGAVLDKSGNVVGIVVAKTNITAEKDNLEVLQQANFAINGDVAKSYLTDNRINFGEAASNSDKQTADIADAAKAFTAIVICQPR